MFRLQTQAYIPNVEIDESSNVLTVNSQFHLYGTLATEDLIPLFESNIHNQWGSQDWPVVFEARSYILRFSTEVRLSPQITREDISRNVDQRNIYIAIEESSIVHISFADGRGSNTGYFMHSNIVQEGSTTIAHEYGHMLGLWPDSLTSHPTDLDQRGQGMPGIMYPRGTLVDPQYQYDPAAIAGHDGGTLDPKHRAVNQNDINVLMTQMKRYDEHKAVLGKLSNRHHLPFLPDQTVS